MDDASRATAGAPATTHGTRTLLVGLAFVLLVLHNLDEGFVHPESGGKLNVVGNVVLGVLVVVAYARLSRRWRIAVVGVLGALATLQALGGHVGHIISGDAAPLDWSGLFYLAGGLLLIGIAVADFRDHDRDRLQTADT